MVLIEILIGGGILSGIELASYITINFFRNRFQWLITKKKDEIPRIDKKTIEEKYFNKGYDSELGWVRRPNAWGHDKIFSQMTTGRWRYLKTKWSINQRGSRSNPKCEHLNDTTLSCYGDSFTFARQVNDNETWEHELSKRLHLNVLNFGVGNYGLDQAILLLERQFLKNPTKIVVMAMVPDTISRIMSYWKHFYEYGNTWAFKPKFEVDKEGGLRLLRNVMNKPEKFFKLAEHIDKLRKHDYFYRTKFKKEIIGFPYSVAILKNPMRNIHLMFSIMYHLVISRFSEKAKAQEPMDTPMMDIIRKLNVKTTVKLYKNSQPVTLLEKLLHRFKEDGKKMGFKPIFIFLPQKNELLYNKGETPFYMPFFQKISKHIETIDVSTPLLAHPDINSLYTEKNAYGAHYSKEGNAFIAKIIYQELTKRGLGTWKDKKSAQAPFL